MISINSGSNAPLELLKARVPGGYVTCSDSYHLLGAEEKPDALRSFIGWMAETMWSQGSIYVQSWTYCGNTSSTEDVRYPLSSRDIEWLQFAFKTGLPPTTTTHVETGASAGAILVFMAYRQACFFQEKEMARQQAEVEREQAEELRQRLTTAITNAIRRLWETRRSFKSKVLAGIRQELEKANS